MKISDLLSMSFNNLIRRKFRTVLTVTGVVIGTCAIISMVSLGLGVQKNNDDLLASMGDLTVIEVYGYSQDAILDDQTITNISAMENVVAASPFQRCYDYNFAANSLLYSGSGNRYKSNISWSVVGVYPESLEALGYNLSNPTVANNNGKKIAMWFGKDAAYNFTDSKGKGEKQYRSSYPDSSGVILDPFVNPETDSVQLVVPYGGDQNSELVFDTTFAGYALKDDYSSLNNIYIDIRELNKIETQFNKLEKIKDTSGKTSSYSQVIVKVDNIDNVSSVEQMIKDLGFETWSAENERESAKESTQQLQLILGALGAITLFVAAISIANTMVMSVYERTKEIGVMKVLGCFVSDIRHIFLTEAALIGFFGGVFGVILSYLISFLLNNYGANLLGQALGGVGGSSSISIVPLWLVGLGMLFSTLIGILSGIYPAYRAVRISALEAIKQE